MPQKLNGLDCFQQLKELSLRNISIPSIAHNDDLPLAHTVRRLSARRSSVSWMEGQGFARLKRFERDEYGWPGSFKQKVKDDILYPHSVLAVCVQGAASTANQFPISNLGHIGVV